MIYEAVHHHKLKKVMSIFTLVNKKLVCNITVSVQTDMDVAFTCILFSLKESSTNNALLILSFHSDLTLMCFFGTF